MSNGKIVGLVALGIIGLMAIAWALGWVAVPFRVTSSENVQKQWTFAYQYEEALRASAAQYCSAKKAVESATSDNEKSQRRSQQLAIEQNYARIQAEYDAKLRNAFEAKLVRPADVPARAATLSDMVLQTCR